MDENNRINGYLWDIQQSIIEIDDFLSSKGRTFEIYQSNTMLRRALERELMIIGEAMNRILIVDSTFTQKITTARSIVNFRNKLAHEYDKIDDEAVWAILINHLPLLKIEIDAIIPPSPKVDNFE